MGKNVTKVDKNHGCQRDGFSEHSGLFLCVCLKLGHAVLYKGKAFLVLYSHPVCEAPVCLVIFDQFCILNQKWRLMTKYLTVKQQAFMLEPDFRKNSLIADWVKPSWEHSTSLSYQY